MANKKLIENMDEFLNRLKKVYKTYELKPLAAEYRRDGRSVYELLIATILSLRTKDPTTYPAAARLFDVANTPEEMVKTDVEVIKKLIYPVGFYKTKAQTIIDISQTLIDKYGGKVPKDRDKLLAMNGVGIKTANLVMAEGFGVPMICVDTHVHRISNRLDLVRTETAEETESKIHKVVPKEFWIDYADQIVAYGQNICSPVSPHCDSKCVIKDFCPQRGVKKHR
jgi:endonuclease-3